MSADTDFDLAFTILLGKAIGVITATGTPEPTTTGGTGSTTTTTAVAVSAGIEYVIDGGGTTITAGNQGGLIVPFPCTINRVVLQEFDGTSGTITVTIQKGTPGASPTFTSIVGGSAPHLSANRYYSDEVLSGWTTTLAFGDALRYVTSSVSSVKRVTVMLYVRRTDVTA